MDFSIEEIHQQVNDIIEVLELRLNPQAIRMIEDESEVPEEVTRPKRDYGEHVALCQALAQTKRDGKSIYMNKLDQWCWNPLIGLGHVPCEPGTEEFEIVAKFIGIPDLDKAREFFAGFPRLEVGKFEGMWMAPAQTAPFVPDVILFSFDNNFQLRNAIGATKVMTGKMMENTFDFIDSCIHSIVTPMNDGKYRVTFPDPGDQERAMAEDNKSILTVPIAKLQEIHDGLMEMETKGGYRGMKREMKFDFPRPPFYNTLYEMWGLDTGAVWDRAKK